MTSIEEINIWLQQPKETQNLEFKEAKNQLPESKLMEYCVAIANEGGGHLVLGVTDCCPRSVVGTQSCNDPTGMASKIFQKVGFRVDVEAVSHPDGRVVVLSIPSRPRGTAYDFEGKYLMRSGSSLVPMSEDRLRAIFDEGKPDWLEEPAKENLTAQDVIELLDTQTFFELLGQPYPTTQQTVIEKLLTERLIDQKGAGYSIQKIGGILLARRFRDFPEISGKAPRVIVYQGRSKIITRIDQIGEKGYASGFQGLISYIMDQLPQNEVIQNALRTEKKLVPEIVIRELVANALIHQNFGVAGASVTIEIYDDRVEISNPGTPIVQVERFIDEYLSRNERMADLMRRMRIYEGKGSGIDKVIEAIEIFQLPPLDVRVDHHRTYVCLFGHKIFEDMNRIERLRACYQHASLRRVMNDALTNQSLRDRFKLPVGKSAIISQIITAAQEEGLIKLDEQVGSSRKYARYLPFWA